MSFESIFFGPGNLISWEKIASGTLPPSEKQSLEPFLDSLRADHGVAILPRIESGKSVLWYVLCKSARMSRFMRDELRGFLGATYSNARISSTGFDRNDPIDIAVLQEYGLNAFKLEVPVALRKEARLRLAQFLSLRIERPNRLSLLVRTASQILKDYEYSLLAGTAADATARLEELRNGGYLSATNILFLEVRVLAASQDWNGIYNHRDLTSLLAIQRPLRVTESLIRAIYHVKLEHFEETGDPNAAVEAFRPIFDTFSDLYRFRGKMASPEVDVSFLLSGVVNPAQSSLVAEEVIQKAVQRNASNLQYLKAIQRLIPAASIPFALDLQGAQLAFGLGEIERASELAHNLPSSYERTALLLRAARELDSLERAQTALEAYYELSDQDRDRITNNVVLSRLLTHFEVLSSAPPVPISPREANPLPVDWESWFAGLSQSTPWPGALEAANLGSQEWDLSALLANPQRLESLSNLIIEVRPAWAHATFRDSLPYLIDFFRLGEADSRLKGVYDALFFAVSVDNEISVSQLHVLNRLADMRLELGTTPDEYSLIAEELSTTIYKLDSPALIDGALETCELLVSRPCGSTEKRLAVFTATASSLSKWHRRATAAQIRLFSILCDELGSETLGTLPVPEVAPDQDEVAWDSLAGARIALYSLQEGAVKRAAQLLRKMIGDTKVDVFSDHVGGSPALRFAAQQADLFVITTAAAKHSATTYIEAKRPKTLPTLYANGQGTSSILLALTRYLTTSA